MCTVSIITASYNYAGIIGEAIDSVLQQEFSDWELIVVDDGSSDNSIDVINAFCQKDQRIKLLTHEGNVNRGLRETVKLGVSASRGRYIAFLECDDRWKPENLSRKIAILEKYPEAALVDDEVELFGDSALFCRYDNYWELRKKLFDGLTFPADIFHRLFIENLIPTFSCAVCRADVLKKCSFDYFYAPHLDRSLWLQICKKHRYYHLTEKLTCWRIHGNSYISRENKTYRKQFLRKTAALLLPCYGNNPMHPGFIGAFIRFTAVNIIRGMKQRFRSKTAEPGK